MKIILFINIKINTYFYIIYFIDKNINIMEGL